MRKMSILIVLVAVIVVVGLGAGALACGAWKVIGSQYNDDYSVAAQIDEIRVTGGTVEVELRPGSGPGVEIHRTAYYLNFFHGRPAPTHRIEGNALLLGGDASATFASIEYVVTAPAGVRVTADIGTGSLGLTNPSTVDAKVSTGSIKIVDATGNVSAHCGTGAISVDLAMPANVEAKTGTGSVDVTVPSSAYRVEASSGLGDVKLGIASDPNGLFRLMLRTDVGSVTLATN